jgi:peroxiredoxin
VLLVVGAITVVAVASGESSTTSANDGRPGCTPSVDGDGATVGDAAPTFDLPGLDGGCVRLASLEDAPIVVNFWASWCHPCRQEFPMLQAAYDEHHDEGLEMVGVTYRDIDDDSREFVADEAATWTFAIDPDQLVADAYGVKAIPQTMFIDRAGTITARFYGPLTADDLDTELAKILRK